MIIRTVTAPAFISERQCHIPGRHPGDLGPVVDVVSIGLIRCARQCEAADSGFDVTAGAVVALPTEAALENQSREGQKFGSGAEAAADALAEAWAAKRAEQRLRERAETKAFLSGLFAN